ncbi:hypothetical protein KUD11_00035 [Roseovarius sp. LXJ103]|uniref:hypothetical protein n=1 Tax=Roseovarius carneus TaxID=2853164 RepID=UPI001CCC31B5|nr:hypothetical protein [Roseovarius carneus]MBZ8117028.1 hypothetical protein [Roseovarius carneus]
MASVHLHPQNLEAHYAEQYDPHVFQCCLWRGLTTRGQTRSRFLGLKYGCGRFLGRAGGAEYTLVRGHDGLVIGAFNQATPPEDGVGVLKHFHGPANHAPVFP